MKILSHWKYKNTETGRMVLCAKFESIDGVCFTIVSAAQFQEPFIESDSWVVLGLDEIREAFRMFKKIQWKKERLA